MKLREIKAKHMHYFEDEQGRMQGEYKDWWSSGELWEISHYHDDKRHGERRVWNKNGQQWILCHYRDGKLHGEYKDWWSNGRQCLICHYRDDEIYGEYKGWDSSGNLIEHTFDIGGFEIFDFIENPELYPETPEERLMFVLKYGNAPFIGDNK